LAAIEILAPKWRDLINSENACGLKQDLCPVIALPLCTGIMIYRTELRINLTLTMSERTDQISPTNMTAMFC